MQSNDPGDIYVVASRPVSREQASTLNTATAAGLTSHIVSPLAATAAGRVRLQQELRQAGCEEAVIEQLVMAETLPTQSHGPDDQEATP